MPKRQATIDESSSDACLAEQGGMGGVLWAVSVRQFGGPRASRGQPIGDVRPKAHVFWRETDR